MRRKPASLAATDWPSACRAPSRGAAGSGRTAARATTTVRQPAARPARSAAVAASARRACPANEPDGTTRPRSRWPRNASSGSTCSQSRCAVRPVTAASSATAVRRAGRGRGQVHDDGGHARAGGPDGGEAVPQVHQSAVAAVRQAREPAGQRGAVLVGVEDDEARSPRQAGEQRRLAGPGHPGDEHERPSGHRQPDRGRRSRPRDGPGRPAGAGTAGTGSSRVVTSGQRPVRPVRSGDRCDPRPRVVRVGGAAMDARRPGSPPTHRREHRRLDLAPPLRGRALVAALRAQQAEGVDHRRPRASPPAPTGPARRTPPAPPPPGAASRCGPSRAAPAPPPPVTSSSNHSTRAGAATSPGGSIGA